MAAEDAGDAGDAAGVVAWGVGGVEPPHAGKSRRRSSSSRASGVRMAATYKRDGPAVHPKERAQLGDGASQGSRRLCFGCALAAAAAVGDGDHPRVDEHHRGATRTIIMSSPLRSSVRG